MSPGLLITHFDAALLSMTACLLAETATDVPSALPTALATGGGVTGAAALALGVAVSEL